jgi:hypothetical protein
LQDDASPIQWTKYDAYLLLELPGSIREESVCDEVLAGCNQLSFVVWKDNPEMKAALIELSCLVPLGTIDRHEVGSKETPAPSYWHVARACLPVRSAKDAKIHSLGDPSQN